jgi:DNA invertase Pin-like site-specific DNA recombinase
MLLDHMATMARLDNDKLIERIKQGQQRAIEAGKRIGGSTKNQEIRSKVVSYIDKTLQLEKWQKYQDVELLQSTESKRN